MARMRVLAPGPYIRRDKVRPRLGVPLLTNEMKLSVVHGIVRGVGEVIS